MSTELTIPQSLSLETEQLSIALRENLQAARAIRTKQSYDQLWKRFQTDTGLDVPVTPLQVAEYLSQTRNQNTGQLLSVATVNAILAAISIAHYAKGLPSPCQDRGVRETLKGIRRTRGIAQRQAQAVTLENVRDMVSLLQDGSLKSQRDKALLLVGFFTAMRRSELAALKVEDIQFTQYGMMVTIRRSKTDQEGAGHSISLDYRVDRVCPVQALKDWLDSAYIVSGPVFLSFYKWDRPRYGKAIDPRNIASLFKKLAYAVNLPNWELVSGHSLRAGLATTAGEQNIPLHQIAQVTGHKHLPTLYKYIRAGKARDNAANKLK